MSHSNLIERLRRLRGPYLGDGTNPGVTTHELIAALSGAPPEMLAEPPPAPLCRRLSDAEYIRQIARYYSDSLIPEFVEHRARLERIAGLLEQRT